MDCPSCGAFNSILDSRCACGHRFDRGGDRQTPDSVPSPTVADHDEPAASVALSGEDRSTISTLGRYVRWTGLMSMGAGILTGAWLIWFWTRAQQTAVLLAPFIACVVSLALGNLLRRAGTALASHELMAGGHARRRRQSHRANGQCPRMVSSAVSREACFARACATMRRSNGSRVHPRLRACRATSPRSPEASSTP